METKDHEYYVSPEVAKLLKEAGFDCGCEYAYYEPFAGIIRKTDIKWCGYVYDAPTLDVAQRWLREVKGVEVYAHVFYDTYDTSEGWDVYVYEVNHIIKQIEDWINSYDVYHSYEEAQEAGLKKALEILLEKKDK